MTVHARDCGAGCSADMSEEQMRLQMAAQVVEIFVRPGRPDLAIKTGFCMLAVPAKPKTVSIDAGGGFQRLDALRDQRVCRLCYVTFQRSCFPAVCDPATHGES